MRVYCLHNFIVNGVDEEEYAAFAPCREPPTVKSGRGRAAEHDFRAGRANPLCIQTKWQ